ncbi:SAM-dependent methyltransferase [Actinomadura barringtoniae]|uniref:SAM-dependent methyltransferase n=1 Tax=Actinomadura barringtoniae TaxID=1427535 RepID=A0A939PSJ8_9ACTN|nr:SAM-dependent methyltransferase [Actinomadura barringtoniae]MBO2455459.1 SAM-dependent methyltransferase [Actinomadura barringtoniae]
MSPGIDTTLASPARIYDFLLGGKDNYGVDRAAAEEIIGLVPDAPLAARLNRAFLTRAVEYLTAAGIRQFIDVGAGLPTQGNVHEVAQRAAPEARVVYVDNDPVVLAHGRALLETSSGVAVIEGDLRRPEEILADARVRELIDFDRPVGLLLMAVLHFVTDEDKPHAHVRRLTDALPPGSHLAVSHGWTGGLGETAFEAAQVIYRRTGSAVQPRDPGEVERFFDGLDLVAPGVTWLSEWRPVPGRGVRPSDPARSCLLGAMGRVGER